MPLPPEGEVTPFDRAIFDDVLRAAVFAADGEMAKPVPFSSIRDPDGWPQPETKVEFVNRIVRTALLHLLEQNLVVFAGDVVDTLDGWVPAERVGTD